VLLARALAQRTKLIVMDEPTAHLDFKNEWEVLRRVTSLVRAKRLSVLMATHFLNQAFFMQNSGVKMRMALMDQSRFRQVGIPDEVLTEKNLSEVYHMHTRVMHHKENGRDYPHIIALNPEGDRNGKDT
jgi:iron complex transport system ATP-binding protein